MSFRAPRVHKRRSSKSPTKDASNSTIRYDESLPSSHHHLVEPHLVQRRRRGYGTKGLINYRQEVLLAEPNGRRFTQPLFPAKTFLRPRYQPIGGDGNLEDDSFCMEDQCDSSMGLHIRESEASPDANRLRAKTKKERQWLKWSNEIIPSLLQPYLNYLRSTQSLREPPPDDAELEIICTCGKETSLKVTCVYFERLKYIVIKYCICSPAPLRLLSMGLFPCTPTSPTLAVDLSMLDFLREMFLRMAPNTSAWCDTLESFLATRRYKLTTRDTLRRRFGNTLIWYTTLVSTTVQHGQELIDNARASVAQPTFSQQSEGSSNHEDSRLRPSEYLRRRCLLCFGGVYTHDPSEVADFLSCVDACFTQKRLKTNGQSDCRDPPRHHPDTVFMAEEDVKAMETFVENCRTRAPPQTSRRDDSDDVLEPGMQVPSSVLNDCGDSFVTADEKRQKASTQFFADTGVMALLCRHDRVLWTVNMTSAGEKQHYVLALIQRLFEHLPRDATVGILYDIGCQLHRSCEKWGFLRDYSPRLSFAISVFHAFGHQWPCQIVYHPRKRSGFGLTDGEGCERFWSSLKALIPGLRVSGYYQRIFTLDAQIKHLDEKSLHSLGHWLNRRWFHTQHKKHTAIAMLDSCGVSEAVLRVEWSNQLREQTKPAPRRSQNKGRHVVETVLALEKTLSIHEENIRNLESRLLSTALHDTFTTLDIPTQLDDLRAQRSRIAQALMHKKAALGVEARTLLTDISTSDYLRLRMNARALKQRIRDRLRHRKFELERLERAYRVTVNEKNLRTHTDSAVKRREPGIVKLAANYNDLCRQISKLITSGRAPDGAVSPQNIAREGLFKLDVDDDIWQDVGLEDDDYLNHAPARWLSDDKVRQGIAALLELDRCGEEEKRLGKERCSMQEWFTEEWTCVKIAKNAEPHDSAMQYQLDLAAENLCRLCVTWQSKIAPIPCAKPLPSCWGPTEGQLQDAAAYEVIASWDVVGDDSTGGDGEVSAHEECDDDLGVENEDLADDLAGELFDSVEAADLTQAYRDESDLYLYLDSMDLTTSTSKGTPSPRKRHRGHLT